MTCIAARETEPYWAPYAASKAALEALVNSYADEVAQSTLRVNLVDPGPMRTAMRFAAFPFEERDKDQAARGRDRALRHPRRKNPAPRTACY